MLNFGGYRGDAILGQALQQSAQTLERRHQIAEEKKYKDAYLAMQQQYADQAKENAEYMNFMRGREMNAFMLDDLDRKFARNIIAEHQIKDSPVIRDDRWFGSDYSINPESANAYLNPEKKSVLQQAYQQSVEEAGLEYDPTRFDMVYNSALGKQAMDIQNVLKAVAQETGADSGDITDMNKALGKSGAGSVISQALLASQPTDLLSSPFHPTYKDGGLSWGEVGMTALGVPQFLGQAGKVGLAVGAGKAAYTAGKAGGVGAGAKAFGEVYSGQSFRKNMASVLKQATTKKGRNALEKKLASKAGTTFAKKMMAKLAIKTAGAGAVNGVPIAGQIASIGLGAWTLWDVMQIVKMLGEE